MPKCDFIGIGVLRFKFAKQRQATLLELHFCMGILL